MVDSFKPNSAAISLTPANGESGFLVFALEGRFDALIGHAYAQHLSASTNNYLRTHAIWSELVAVKYPQIKALRETALGHVSQQGLARLAGLGRNVISNLEAGRRADADLALAAISAATGISEDSLREEGPLYEKPLAGDQTRKPYTKESFERWKQGQSRERFDQAADCGVRFLQSIAHTTFHDPDGTPTPGRAESFFLRLGRFLQSEAEQAGLKAVELHLIAQGETHEVNLLASELAELLPKRIVPTTGSFTGTLTIHPALPVLVSQWTKMEMSALKIRDDGERSLEMELEPDETLAILKAIQGRTRVGDDAEWAE